jgi:hypothetical protein
VQALLLASHVPQFVVLLYTRWAATHAPTLDSAHLDATLQRWRQDVHAAADRATLCQEIDSACGMLTRLALGTSSTPGAVGRRSPVFAHARPLIVVATLMARLLRARLIPVPRDNLRCALTGLPLRTQERMHVLDVALLPMAPDDNMTRIITLCVAEFSNVTWPLLPPALPVAEAGVSRVAPPLMPLPVAFVVAAAAKRPRPRSTGAAPKKRAKPAPADPMEGIAADGASADSARFLGRHPELTARGLVVDAATDPVLWHAMVALARDKGRDANTMAMREALACVSLEALHQWTERLARRAALEMLCAVTRTFIRPSEDDEEAPGVPMRDMPASLVFTGISLVLKMADKVLNSPTRTGPAYYPLTLANVQAQPHLIAAFAALFVPSGV